MKTVDIWHQILSAGAVDRLNEILAEDCVFWSPVVHSPQRGRELTKLYLSGAMQVLNKDFRYLKEVVSEQHAVLEFECDVEGTVVNGVDIMTFDSAGKIVEFKVMLRPLQAVNKVHNHMREMLQRLSA